MHLKVTRFISDADSTLSYVSLDGRFVCFGLEDEYREHKRIGETRIPPGSYPVALRNVGGFHARYARRFGNMHRGMLHIENVPNFKYVLIHCGNTDGDTAGCLLVGAGANTELGNMSLLNSRSAYQDLYIRVVHAAKLGELRITFTDDDDAFVQAVRRY